MSFKITKEIVRSYLQCQDRDIVFGTQADAALAGVKKFRLDLLREVTSLETQDDKAISKVLASAELPKSVAPRDFVIALRVLACLAAR